MINEYQISYFWTGVSDMLRCMHVQSMLSQLNQANTLRKYQFIRFNQEKTTNIAQIAHNRGKNIRNIATLSLTVSPSHIIA